MQGEGQELDPNYKLEHKPQKLTPLPIYHEFESKLYKGSPNPGSSWFITTCKRRGCYFVQYTQQYQIDDVLAAINAAPHCTGTLS